MHLLDDTHDAGAFNEVTDLVRAEQDDQNAGRKVRQGALQCEADGQAGSAEYGDEGRRLDTQCADRCDNDDDE